MEFDRPVDGGLGATSGGVEDKDKLRNDMVLGLRPEHSARGGDTDTTAKGTTQKRGSPTEGTSGYDG